MADLIGKDSGYAIAKGATWGTAVLAAANDGILLDGEGLTRERELIVDEPSGLNYIQNGDVGNETISGDLSGDLRYEGFDTLLALAMGTAGAPSQIAATAAYSNSYVLKDNLSGLFATYAVSKGGIYVAEYDSVKIHGFTISGAAGESLKIAFHCIGRNRVENTSGGTNDNTTFASVTIPDVKNRVLMSQTLIRMNDESSGALASTANDITPISFEFTYKRPMRDSDFAANSSVILEPIEDGHINAEMSLKMTFSRITATTLIDEWEAGTTKKIDIQSIGAVIEDSNTYEFDISIPSARYSIAPTDGIDGAGATEQEVTFVIEQAASNPTGMAFKVPQIDIINTLTTDPLA